MATYEITMQIRRPGFGTRPAFGERPRSEVMAVAFRLEDMPDSLAAWTEAFRLARESGTIETAHDVAEATCVEISAPADTPEALARDAERFRAIVRNLERRRIMLEIREDMGRGSEVISTPWRFTEIADRLVAGSWPL